MPFPKKHSAMVWVSFRCDGVEESYDVERTSSLADVQQLLCRLYRQSFPAKKAIMTSNGLLFDVFVQYPFKNSNEGAMYEVEFENTDEVLFYDKFDRCLNITLEEEIAYEDAEAAGTITTCIDAWVLARRAELHETADA